MVPINIIHFPEESNGFKQRKLMTVENYPYLPGKFDLMDIDGKAYQIVGIRHVIGFDAPHIDIHVCSMDNETSNIIV